MGNEHSSITVSSRNQQPREVLLKCRMADDGEWYTWDDFVRHYSHDAKGRWDQAPLFMERRWSTTDSNYRDAPWFFERFGKGGTWVNHNKPGWDSASLEKRLGDDGKWYTLSGFQDFYPHDWEDRWVAAPREDQRKFGDDGLPHDALWFYRKNESSGGRDWSKNSKTLWDTATTAPRAGSSVFSAAVATVAQALSPKRLADDGKYYTEEEFRKFYPSDFTLRWSIAPKQEDRRFCTRTNGMHDPLHFFEQNKRAGGEDWNKNSKPGWDGAPSRAPMYSTGPAAPVTAYHAGGGGGVEQKRLADDGKWYPRSEFLSFYDNQTERWDNAPKFGEYRYGSDGVAHDAEWFYRENKRNGGDDWNKYRKALWDDAPKCATMLSPSMPYTTTTETTTTYYY
ncbi:unnamed protein product [Amoebophrya sp. A25]|nr:unnamed protein product [Amoebophrya sp. A25]|eukprot:GSA25T00009726001.1